MQGSEQLHPGITDDHEFELVSGMPADLYCICAVGSAATPHLHQNRCFSEQVVLSLLLLLLLLLFKAHEGCCVALVAIIPSILMYNPTSPYVHPADRRCHQA
jgi:hypothetical protein